jgi:hypothetical protein
MDTGPNANATIPVERRLGQTGTRSRKRRPSGSQCPLAHRLADTTAIPPLSRLFMVGMGMLCRHVGVRDHGNDQHSICY